MNKDALRQLIIAQLRTDLDQQVRAAALARDEAISEESQPENKYDTHSQEAAYLAQGQARLAADIAASVEVYRTLPLPELNEQSPIAIGAVVRVDRGAASNWFFIGPRAGGLEFELEGKPILVLTPQSPLGRELVGRRVGDSARLPGPAGAPPGRIAAVL